MAEQCRACGGTGGHWEGCRGEAELMLENESLRTQLEAQAGRVKELEGEKAELVMALRDTLRFFNDVTEDAGIRCAGITMTHAQFLVKKYAPPQEKEKPSTARDEGKEKA